MALEGFTRHGLRNGVGVLVLTAGLVLVSLPRDAAREFHDAHAPPEPIASSEPVSLLDGSIGAQPGQGPSLPAWMVEALETKMPVRVRLFDALTGRALTSTRWREAAPAARADPPPRPRDARWLTSGDVAVLTFPFDRIEIEIPEGYVLLPVEGPRAAPVARARMGLLAVPLYPEARVAARFGVQVIAAGLSGTVTEVSIGRHSLPVRAPSSARGPRALRGIPFMAGEPIGLTVRWERAAPGHGAWCGSAALGIELESRTQWSVRLLDRPEQQVFVDIDVAQEGPQRHVDTGWEPQDPWDPLPSAASSDRTSWDPLDVASSGAVALRLLDRTGRPAVGVRVGVGPVQARTDDAGRARLSGVLPGERVVQVLDSGWVIPSARVPVASEGTTTLEVRELEGGEVGVRVEDLYGAPVPFAKLAFCRSDSCSWWDVDEAGVQRLDPYVGAVGRRVLSHVPTGLMQVHASVGSRTSKTRVEVVEGGHHVVTITLPSPVSR